MTLVFNNILDKSRGHFNKHTLNAKCHEVILLDKLLIMSVTSQWFIPQNGLSDTLIHVTLNIINFVAQFKILPLQIKICKSNL